MLLVFLSPFLTSCLRNLFAAYTNAHEWLTRPSCCMTSFSCFLGEIFSLPMVTADFTWLAGDLEDCNC